MLLKIGLKFGNGDFQHGFDKNTLTVSVVNSQNPMLLETHLTPSPNIPVLYQKWKDEYINLADILGARVKIKKITKFSWSERYQDYEKITQELLNNLNEWLDNIKIQLESLIETELNYDSEIIFTIYTQNIKSTYIKDILHRLPWQEWDYLNKYSVNETVLCLNESQPSLPSVVDDGIFRRVRITSIFGDSTNIDVATDKELIEKLYKRGAELINLEQPRRQDFIKLWDEPCDILFYSGHSISRIDGTIGSLQINSTESLNLEEVRNTFGEAIKKGLKVAFFNSCDGLGLAHQLADLNLPFIIVWREPVPDKVAQTFLEYFLRSYAYGKSLFTSVRDARVKLKELTGNTREKQLPGVEWLPFICQNITDKPPTWEDLGGLMGRLPENPYQGLSAFAEVDAPYFFGREKFLTELLEAVNNRSLVPIVGASGSGKSSVVFAGLVPQLREVGMQIVSFRLGNNPFDALASVLKNLPLPTEVIDNGWLEELEVNLEGDEKALCRFIEETIKYQDKNNLLSQRFILIADQFEELYTLAPESQQQPFLNALLYAIKFAPNFCLVLTLRADFYGQAISHREFSDVLQKRIYNSSPMNREELRATIAQPAEKMKVQLESGLTDKLIDELGNQARSLPLLEFTLSLLWEKHYKWYLTHQAYKEIGGLKQALAQYADGVLHPLSTKDKERAERIFIQLISPGEGTEDTKRQATRGEVGEENWDLVHFLANKRLVVTGWDKKNKCQTVEIIHEVLIREWGMLQKWIKSNRQFRIWQERLQFEVVKWENKQCSNDYLLSGGALVEAEDWYFYEKYRDYLSNSQAKFIRESLRKRYREEEKNVYQQQEKVRLQKRAIFWLSGGLVAASLATGFACWNWIKAERSATISRIDSFRANSEYLFSLQQYEDALIEGIKGNELMRNSWWRNSIPSYIEQKVQLALNNAIRNSIILEKNTIMEDEDEINHFEFSPDGKTIAASLWNNTVKLWSANNGKLLYRLPSHKKLVTSIEFSSDSKIIASASLDETVKLWSTENGKLLRTLPGNKYSFSTVKFSPDSKTVTSASSDNTLKIWSVNNGKLIHTLSGHQDLIASVKFSPDNKTIASASLDGTIKIWSTNNGKLLHTLSGNKDLVANLDFSSDSKTIASASRDNNVKLWSVNNGKLLHTLSGHKDRIIKIKLSPDSKTIASASRDNNVKLWSVNNGKILHTFSEHKKPVLSIEFSSNSQTIASASEDKTVKWWSTDDGELLHTFSGHKSWVNSVKFSPNDKTIASVSGDGKVKLWSIEETKLPKNFNGHKDSVTSVRFSQDGKIISSASLDGTVKLWSTKNGRLLHTSPEQKNLITNVKLNPDGKTISLASLNGTVRLWPSQKRKLIDILLRYKDRAKSIELSPDSKTIALVLSDYTIKLLSAEDGKLLHSLSGHEFSISNVAFSSDNKTITSSSLDKTVKLWSIKDGKLLHTIIGHTSEIFNVEFSPDSKMIASASADNTIKLWSSKNGNLIITLSGHKGSVNSVEFSDNGEVIVSASDDGTVKLWSADNGKLLHTLTGHKDSVTSVDFSPDGKTIASASKDKTVKLWNWNFDNLTTRGCNKLQGYLINHPEKLEELKVCQLASLEVRSKK